MSYRICHNERPTMLEITVPIDTSLRSLVKELSLIVREHGDPDVLVHSLHISGITDDEFNYTMVVS